MFKKFILILSLFSIMLVDARANSDLKLAFDDLNYSLSVEWDQQDQDFYAHQINKFSQTVEKLNLSSEELLQFVQAEIKNKKLAQEMIEALKIIKLSRMDTNEASQYMRDIVDQT